MDQPEEPMELDSSVSYVDTDDRKLDDTTDSKIFINDSNDSKIDEQDSLPQVIFLTNIYRFSVRVNPFLPP